MTTTVTVADEMLTTTTFAYLTDIKANMRHIPQPYFENSLKLGKIDNEGGLKLFIPYEMHEHSLPKRVTAATAYGNYNMWSQPTMLSGQEDWAYVVQPVFISRWEKNLNRGKHELINIAKDRVQNVYDHLLRQGQKALLIGPAASGTWTGVPEWDDFIPANGTDYPTGLLEEDASGTNTIHGVSRATYPATTHPLFHNIAADVANSASTNLLDRGSGIRATMDIRGAVAQSSFRWYCTQAFFQNLTKILRPQLQYATIKAGDTQMETPIFLGKPIQAVQQLPDTGVTSTTYKWSCVGVTHGKEGLALQVQTGNNLDMDPWATLPGTVGVQAALFHFMAQQTLLKAGRNVVIVRAETY